MIPIADRHTDYIPHLSLRLNAGGQQRIDAESETLIGGSFDVAPTIKRDYGKGYGDGELSGALVAHSLRGEGHDASESGTGRGTPIVPIWPIQEVGKRESKNQNGVGIGIASHNEPMYTLQAGACHGVGSHEGVRRLTPRECERLQGFPDDYTLIPYRGKPACDGPRYRAIGNSMAVPCMRWIGERIQAVSDILKGEAA